MEVDDMGDGPHKQVGVLELPNTARVSSQTTSKHIVGPTLVAGIRVNS